MKHWVYVRVDAPKEDLTMISFDHCFVETDEEETAYELGAHYFLKHPNEAMLKQWTLMNDYVAELPDEAAWAQSQVVYETSECDKPIA